MIEPPEVGSLEELRDHYPKSRFAAYPRWRPGWSAIRSRRLRYLYIERFRDFLTLNGISFTEARDSHGVSFECLSGEGCFFGYRNRSAEARGVTDSELARAFDHLLDPPEAVEMRPDKRTTNEPKAEASTTPPPTDLLPDEPEGPAVGPLAWAGNNVAWVTSLALAGFVVFRVERVSHGNPSTASALVHSTGVPSLALAIIAHDAGIISFLVAVLAADAATELTVAPANRQFFRVLFGLLAGIALVLAPWYLAILLILEALLVFTREATIRTLNLRSRDRRSSAATLILVAFAVRSLVFVGVDKPWLPPEKFSTTSAPTSPVVGYALDESNEWLTILVEKSRQVVRIHTKDISERTLCKVPKSGPELTLAELVSGSRPASPYPPC